MVYPAHPGNSAPDNPDSAPALAPTLAPPAVDPVAAEGTFAEAPRSPRAVGAQTTRTTVLPRIDGDGARVRLIQKARIRHHRIFPRSA